MTIAFIITAIVVAWFVFGIANHYFYPRVMGGVERNQRDFLVLLGPVGSFMLLLFFAVQGFLTLCAFASKSFGQS